VVKALVLRETEESLLLWKVQANGRKKGKKNPPPPVTGREGGGRGEGISNSLIIYSAEALEGRRGRKKKKKGIPFSLLRPHCHKEGKKRSARP